MRWYIAMLILLLLMSGASTAGAQSPTNTPTPAPSSSPTPGNLNDLIGATPASIDWLSLPATTPIAWDHVNKIDLNVTSEALTADGINYFVTALDIYRDGIKLIINASFFIFMITVMRRVYKRMRKEKGANLETVFFEEAKGQFLGRSARRSKK